MTRLRTAAQVARRRPVAALLDHRGREIQQKYDVLESNKQRRKATIERQDESKIYDQTRRLKGCNLGRDLERNYSPAAGLLHQFRMNVVGVHGKLQINDEGGEETAAWFNEVWAADCDYRTDMHFGDWLGLTVNGILREGDQLTVFDDGLVEGSGKLLTWEADQVTPLSSSAFKSSRYKGKRTTDTQDNGIIRDEHGREKCYVATGKRGFTAIDTLADATIYPRGLARLIRNPWRHNQGRGVPHLVTPAANFLDLYEILSSTLQTTKRAAKQYGFIQREDAVTDYDDPASDPEFLPENMGKTATTVDAEGANLATATGAQNYERLEQFLGGYIDYIRKGDSVTIPEVKHPSGNLEPFMDAVHGFSGAALGIAAAYTRLRADSSYTAFRGDMIMTWVTFRYWQKWVERYIADWVARNVITWAIKVKPPDFVAPPKGWARKLAWTWPVMPEVNVLAAEKAIAQALKNGTTSYAELLGPDWAKKFASYGEQLKTAKQEDLPLGVFETKAGGAANPNNDGQSGGGTA